jgi:hypothetical protein
MPRLLTGFLGGAVGTAAMTLAMRAMHRRLPARDRYPLPPRQIAIALAEKSGVGAPAHENDRKALTMTLHYSYGIGMGGLFALLTPPTRWMSLASGPLFGLAVWTGSYLGWLPAVGLHPPATRESAPRNGLMVASHLVWSGVIGAVVEALGREDDAHHAHSSRTVDRATAPPNG